MMDRVQDRVRSDAGFTVIEVVVAIMISIVVVSGLAMAVGAASRVEVASSARAKMASVGEAVYEELSADRSWMTACLKVASCNLSARIPADVISDDTLGPGFKFTVTATGRRLDLKLDGTGAADEDGVVADAFEVTIVISMSPADKTRLLGNKDAHDYVLVAGMDRQGARLGSSAIVEICAATNQSDDRMALGGCSTRHRDLLMAPCRLSDDECDAYEAIDHRPPDSRYETPYMRTIRIDTSFTLRGPLNDSRVPPANYNSGTHAKKIEKGLYEFTNLPTGQYEIRNLAPNPTINTGPDTGVRKLERWPAQDVPQHGKITVEHQHEAHALIGYRPIPPDMPEILFGAQRKVAFLEWGPEKSERNLGWNLPWTDSCEWFASFAPDGMYTGEDVVDPVTGETTPGTPVETGSWLCYNRQDRATFHYLVPQIRWETWRGSAVKITVGTHPEPQGRIYARKGDNDYSNEDYESKTTLKAHNSWDGSWLAGHNHPQDGIPKGCYTCDQELLNDFKTTGLHSGLYSTTDGVSFTNCVRLGESDPTIPCTRVWDRIWIDPLTGHLNGAKRHNMTVDTTGECYVTLPNTKLLNGIEAGFGFAGAAPSPFLVSGGYVNSGAYKHREQGACGADGCSAFFLPSSGKSYSNVCTMLIKGCDSSEVWTAYLPDADPTVEGPSTPVEDARMVLVPMYSIMACDGYYPPYDCDPSGSNCGPAQVILPPTYSGQKGKFISVTVSPGRGGG